MQSSLRRSRAERRSAGSPLRRVVSSRLRVPWCVALVLMLALAPRHPASAARVYDVAIVGGRVMDPASHLDRVANVGISGDRVAVITARPIRGRRTVPAKGLVVAPGFIDMLSGSNPE